jgi:hypothetical protein
MEEGVTFESVAALYRHEKRSDWGLGVILEQRVDRVTMQFQDGRTRAMHLDYWDLFKPADRSYDAARALVTALHAMAPEELRPVFRKTAPPISLSEQALYFRELYDGGFESTAYLEEHRSDGRKRPLKRHRDGMVLAAEKHLTREALRAAEEKDGAAGVHAALKRVLDVSSIVPAKERERFAKVDPEQHGRVADAARMLIHGKAPVVQRLDAWVRELEVALGEAPSWELATYFLGACHPKTMPIVRPGALERQAKFMSPGLRVGERPMGILYERLSAMMLDIRDRLAERDLKTRDLLDVYDFIWLTLKPAGRQRIMAMRAERGGEVHVDAVAEERAAA